jgi:DnaJ homolog subfamily A member 2
LSLSLFLTDANKTGTVKVVRGQGMPSPRHHDFGNLYIQFDVKFPERLGTEESPFTPKQVAELEAILPPRVTPPQIPADAMVEDFVLEEVDPTREGRVRGALDDDDDEMHAGGERVQCATQ